jgi:ubiquinone/menaquinone biosynthesis C-methylase UbiE
MTTTFDALAEHYDAGRIGYANEIYNHLVAFGLTPKHRILDVGCGTGLASRPLLDNTFTVVGVDPSERMLAHAKRRYPDAQWVVGTAEKLPFENASFDAVISAQIIQRVDRGAAIAEMIRVLKPNGLVAIWWKVLMNDEGGFKEFYAAPLRNHTIRIVPWRASMPASQIVQMERSRASVHENARDRAETYFKTFERRLGERFGQGDPYVPLAFTHYLYLAKK